LFHQLKKAQGLVIQLQSEQKHDNPQIFTQVPMMDEGRYFPCNIGFNAEEMFGYSVSIRQIIGKRETFVMNDTTFFKMSG
jgi:hypothetical protein